MHQGTGDKWEWSYYYNSDDHECQAFIYYGSGGNNNRFSDKPMCDNACNGRILLKFLTCVSEITSASYKRIAVQTGGLRCFNSTFNNI